MREDEWRTLEPEIRAGEPREALVAGADGLDAIRELVAAGARRHAAVRSSTRRPGGAPCARCCTGAETRRDLAGRERVTPWAGARDPRGRRDLRALHRRSGGVALFPADTVYGLATEPDSREGVDRLYRSRAGRRRGPRR